MDVDDREIFVTINDYSAISAREKSSAGCVSGGYFSKVLGRFMNHKGVWGK